MKTTNSGLQTVEYLFVALTMVGIAITTFTQEITYAAIPLIITVLLNLFNRQQMEENILLLEKKILEEKPENKEEFSSVNSAENFKTIETKIEDTQGAIAQLQQDFQQLSISFNPNEFKSQLRDLQTCIESFNSVDLSPLEEEIKNLHHRLDNFAQVHSEIDQIKQHYRNLEKSVQDSKNEINSLPTRSELEELKQNIDSLTQIKNEFNTLVNWESFNKLSSQLTDLVDQFNHRPEPETIRSLSNEVKTVSESLSNLDFNQFGEQIKKLREQFEAIPQKDLVEALSEQEDELNKIEEKIEKVEEEILANQSPMNPRTKQRILKPKPRRVRINQRRR